LAIAGSSTLAAGITGENGHDGLSERSLPRLDLRGLPSNRGLAAHCDGDARHIDGPRTDAPTPGQSAWKYAGASGIASFPWPFSNVLTAPQGSRAAFLQTFRSDSSASVCQSVGGFQAGVEYFIRAQLAHRSGCLSCSAAVDVHSDVDQGWIPVDSYVL
jgi:hypothetical protein